MTVRPTCVHIKKRKKENLKETLEYDSAQRASSKWKLYEVWASQKKKGNPQQNIECDISLPCRWNYGAFLVHEDNSMFYLCERRVFFFRRRNKKEKKRKSKLRIGWFSNSPCAASSSLSWERMQMRYASFFVYLQPWECHLLHIIRRLFLPSVWHPKQQQRRMKEWLGG